jgi:hypothetical protein
MAGKIKLDGTQFLEKVNNEFKITNSELKLKSTGNTIVDSSGNAVVSESGGNVTLGNVRLPSTGGIKDSSGNNILTESGGNVSIGDLRLPSSGGIKDSAGNNVLSESGGVVSISSGTQFPAGHVIKMTQFDIPRGTFSATPTWPYDDTRPQLNEGVTVFSQSYTPTTAASKLLIQVYNLFLYETSNIADAAVVGLFISGTNDCLTVFPGENNVYDQGGKHSNNLNGSFLMNSYSGSKTFYIQKGSGHQSVGKWYNNGWQDVADRFDGNNNPFGRFLISEIS